MGCKWQKMGVKFHLTNEYGECFFALDATTVKVAIDFPLAITRNSGSATTFPVIVN